MEKPGLLGRLSQASDLHGPMVGTVFYATRLLEDEEPVLEFAPLFEEKDNYWRYRRANLLTPQAVTPAQWHATLLAELDACRHRRNYEITLDGQQRLSYLLGTSRDPIPQSQWTEPGLPSVPVEF
jgi:hypothetical protein